MNNIIRQIVKPHIDGILTTEKEIELVRGEREKLSKKMLSDAANGKDVQSQRAKLINLDLQVDGLYERIKEYEQDVTDALIKGRKSAKQALDKSEADFANETVRLREKALNAINFLENCELVGVQKNLIDKKRIDFVMSGGSLHFPEHVELARRLKAMPKDQEWEMYLEKRNDLSELRNYVNDAGAPTRMGKKLINSARRGAV